MCVCGMRKRRDGKASGSAARRTRGAAVPSLIPRSLLLPLPCSAAQEEDAAVRRMKSTPGRNRRKEISE